MTTAGHGACWLTWWLTEPRTNPLTPLTPLEPTTTPARRAASSTAAEALESTTTCSGRVGQSSRVDLACRLDERVMGGLLQHLGEQRRRGVVEGIEHRRPVGVHDGDRRLAGSGFAYGPRQRPDRGVRAVDADDNTSGSVVWPLLLVADHGDGTCGVMQAMPADRPDEQPAEPAQPARADHQQVGAATRQLPGRSHTTVRPTVTPAGPTARSMSSLSTAAARSS